MYQDKKELEEAIMAGERALSSLEQARQKLNSAGNWGMFDLFGGGLFTDMIKHSKINDAKPYLEDAKRNLMLFRKEMSDVGGSMEVQLELGNFLTFADFFFDGIIADYMVQSKISDAKHQTESAISQVTQILEKLRRMLG